MIKRAPVKAQQQIIGFKSPADDYLEGRLNISDLLVVDEECTFYFKMDSDALAASGIYQGDLMIVDRAVRAADGALVIACVDGEFLCRWFFEVGGKNKQLTDGVAGKISFTGKEDSIYLWGVVTAVCRNTLPAQLRRGRYSHVCAL